MATRHFPITLSDTSNFNRQIRNNQSFPSAHSVTSVVKNPTLRLCVRFFERVQNDPQFTRLIRFSHTLFALPFALLAAMMAWRLQNFQIRREEIVGILLCMITARSFAMAFNRLADRHIDATNPHTIGRHLPAGILSVPQVTFFATVCAVGFIASTLLFLPNHLPLMLSIPVLAFLAGYSFAKRFTMLANFWLGAALALSPMAAWIAIRGAIVLATPSDLLPAVALGGAVITWVAGFDIIYACQDYDVDVAAGHYSIPARVGIPRLRLAAACHAATLYSWPRFPSSIRRSAGCTSQR